MVTAVSSSGAAPPTAASPSLVSYLREPQVARGDHAQDAFKAPLAGAAAHLHQQNLLQAIQAMHPQDYYHQIQQQRMYALALQQQAAAAAVYTDAQGKQQQQQVQVLQVPMQGGAFKQGGIELQGQVKHEQQQQQQQQQQILNNL